MNKEQKLKQNELKAIVLINKTEAINNIAIKAEPFVIAYWRTLKDLWTKPVGYQEVEMIKEQLVNEELKNLNNAYKLLLK